MNILKELNALPARTKDLRNFGLLVGGILTAIGAWFHYRGKPSSVLFLYPGVFLVFFGLVWPRSLRLLYLGWMALALVLGFIVSNVILTIFFYLVITPFGLVARLFGKDFLRKKNDPHASTYWIERDGVVPSSEKYLNQF